MWNMWHIVRSRMAKAQKCTRTIRTRHIGRITNLIRSRMDNPKAGLENFTGSAAVIISDKNHHRFVESTGALGREDDQNGTQYVAPLDEVINAIRETNADLRQLERKFGLNSGSLGSEARVVIVYAPFSHNLRKTHFGAPGANELFIEGGKTIGGISEALIDRTPEEKVVFMPSDQEGLLESCNYRSEPVNAFTSTNTFTSWLASLSLWSVEEK